MKIGIFAENILPETGGRHSFGSEVLQSVATLKFGAENRSTFVVYSFAQEPPPAIARCQHIHFRSLYRSFPKRLSAKLYGTATAIINKLQDPQIRFRVGSTYEKFILNSILTDGIDILWYPGHHYLTLEIPYIITVFDLQHRLQPYFPEVSAEGGWDIREHYFEKILKRASVVITGTETGKAEIERFYQVPGIRIKVVPLPTPHFALTSTPENSTETIIRYNLPKDYLLYPAQFWAHKNHVGLLLALQWLRDQYQLIFPIVFVGSDKGNQHYIKELVAQLDLSAQVYFLGFVPQENLISLYRNAFALIFPTFFGPDNLPPLEAFALGCPVIASNVSGSQEQLGDAALLFNSNDEKQIAMAIKSLHDDPSLRQKLVQRGLARASIWTGQDYVKSMLAILEEFEPIRRCWNNRVPYKQLK